MPFVNSPNMGFPVPTVSVELGPQYATDVNQALFTLDSHNHSPGQGVPIGAQSINIQSDLSFNINNAVNLRTVRFVSTTASSGTDVGCIYVKGVDLFYNDLNANVVRLTLNGGLASTSLFTGQISTTAIVSANGAGSPASSGFIRMVNNADHINWRNAANNADDSFYVDNSDAFHMVGPAYDYKFPTTLPTSTLPLSVATNGNISFGLITRPQLPNVGLKTSLSSGSYSTTSSTTADVTNLSVTMTTAGRPVFLTLVPDDGTNGEAKISSSLGANSTVSLIYLTRNSISVAGWNLSVTAVGATTVTTAVPCGMINYIDLIPSSSWTYQIQAKSSGGSATQVTNCRLFAYEL